MQWIHADQRTTRAGPLAPLHRTDTMDFALRRLRSSDSLDDLTALLHRAFAPMARRGLHCRSASQDAAGTRRRIGHGACFVALAGGVIVGAITLQPSDPASPIRRYRDDAVASIHQFAVDPRHQRLGIGRALMRAAAAWARVRGFTELALDTPVPAADLRVYYARQGFGLVDIVQVDGRDYRSAVMSRALGPDLTANVGTGALFAWPARHPAEMAALALDAKPPRRRVA